MRYRPKHIVEYAATRAAVWLVNVLPYCVSLALAWTIGGLVFYVLRFRVTETERRIREVFGSTVSPAQVRRIAWLSWRNCVFTAVEATRGPKTGARWIARHVDHTVIDAIMQPHLASRRGAVLACPHLGSWELAGILGRRFGFPMFTIAGRQRNPLFNDYLNRLRQQCGMEVLVRGTSSLKAIVSRLKRGECFAILPDVRVIEGALPVRFLGKTAHIGRGMGLFAHQANVPVIICMMARVGWGRHTMVAFPPIWPDPALDREQDCVRITQAVMELIDQAIRAHPEQWFWLNKRWILDPL